MKGGYVYIMTAKRDGTLYIGVTSNLSRRVWEHREGIIDGFTKRYGLKRLVYYEPFDDIRNALQRERNLKHWPRAWKLALLGLQLFGGLQLCAQQPDFRALAAAKAAAAREALTHAGNLIPRANAPAAGNFIAFDVPGAATGSYQGTEPFGITPVGAITGYYYDANYVGHGFLRTVSGSYITFDVTGDVNGTFPQSISLTGAITGYYYDVNYVGHGFLRASALSPRLMLRAP